MALSRQHRSQQPTRQPRAAAARAAPAAASAAPEIQDLQGAYGNAFAADAVKTAASTPPPADPRAAFDAASSGGGGPVPFAAQMESSFGEDFSGVQAHVGQAGPMEALGAQAAAAGEDVAFASPNPDRKTVAHELAHVVQQRRAGGRGVQQKAVTSSPGDASEREADAVADTVASGGPAEVSEAPTGEVQGGFLDDVVLGARNLYHDVAEGVGLETADEATAARLQAFREHGMFGPSDLVPPTNIGGFEASYDPASEILNLTIRGGVDFIDGVSIDAGGVITSNHEDLDQAATDGNSIPDLAGRQAFAAQFHWTDQAAWIASLQSRVEAAWGLQFLFHCTRPGWEELMAIPLVTVDIHEGANPDDGHLQVKTYKVPEDRSYEVGAYVDSAANDPDSGANQDPHDNEMVLSSTDVENGPDVPSLLRWTANFEFGSAVLPPDEEDKIRRFAVDFQDANGDLSNPVVLIGRASAPGTEEANRRLAQQRIDAVRTVLQSAGFTNMEDRVSARNMGETGAGEGDEWCRVDLEVCGGRGQFVAAHEFGHAFGLDDEYAVHPDPTDPTGERNLGNISGTGTPTGTITGNNDMARAIGAPGSIAENNDDIMSLGSTVRPQHYATFGWALRTITGVDTWQVG